MKIWQNKKAKKLYKRISKVIPYYKNTLITNWQNLPIMNKKIMMDLFNDLNDSGISKSDAFRIALKAEKSRNFTPMLNGITVGLSNGTTGNRGIFLLNSRERYMWGGNVLAKVLPGKLWESYAIAFFLRANSNLYTTINSKKINFKYFDIMEDINIHIQALNNFKPDILVAQPSILRILAKSQLSKKLKIYPKKIISIAEVLESLDKKLISQTFNQDIHQIYQATEGFIATTCKEGSLHLNEDLLIIEKEYLDKENGKFIPIITDLNRTTQPILRYKLDDILTQSKSPCKCGSVFQCIEKIEGRCDDIFYLKKLNSAELKPIFPDLISRSMIYSDENFDEYKIIQKEKKLIEIELSFKGEKKINSYIENKIKKSLFELCYKMKVEKPDIIFSEYKKNNSIKKLKRIENQTKSYIHK